MEPRGAEQARTESKRGPQIRLTLAPGEGGGLLRRVAGAGQAERSASSSRAGGGVRAVESSLLTRRASGRGRQDGGRAGRGLTFTAALRCLRVRFSQGCALTGA